MIIVRIDIEVLIGLIAVDLVALFMLVTYAVSIVQNIRRGDKWNTGLGTRSSADPDPASPAGNQQDTDKDSDKQGFDGFGEGQFGGGGASDRW